MQPILIVAEEQELKMAKAMFPSLDYIITGVGALNIMRQLQGIPKDRELINIGYAGSANFEVGSWVQVSEVRLNHPNVNYPEPEFQLLQSKVSTEACLPENIIIAPCYTGVDFVLQSDYKDCVFDMELAFICGLGFENVRSYKYVSDNLSLHDYRKVGAGV